MSFFDDASLAFLPSGGAGKDTKAYSIKPTDGSGDFTFSRGSNLAATRVGPTGLIEKGRENLLLQSNNFDTTWTDGGTATLTSGQSGYDGSNDAWLLEALSASFIFYQGVSSSGVCTFSIYAKAGTTDKMAFYVVTSPSTRAGFDLSSGTIDFTLRDVDASIEDVGNGWYRCSMAFEGASTSVRIYPTDSSLSPAIGDNILIQDAQLEIGLAATEVITTGATTGKAGLLEDEPRFDYSGGATCPSLLLEPSRTNLMTYSEIFQGSSGGYWRIFDNGTIEPNYGISPEGVNNSTKIGTSGGNNDFVYNSITISSGTTYTLSCFVKNIDATESLIYGVNTTDNDLTWSGSTLTSVAGGDFEPVGNGWYRIWITTTSTSTSAITRIYSDRNGGTGSIEIYGFQVEAGSYPTSYIPNHSGGSVTRGAESCIKTSYPDLSSQQELTLYTEFNYEQSGRVIAIGNGTTSTRLFASYGSDKQMYMYLNIGGTLAFFLTSPNDTLLDGKNKVAVKIKSGESLLYLNGTEIFNNTSTFTLSGFQNVYIATSEYGSTNNIQKIDSALIFYNALSAADLATLTTL